MTSSTAEQANNVESKQEFIAEREKKRQQRLKAMERRRNLRQQKNAGLRDRRAESDKFLKQFTAEFDNIENKLNQISTHQQFKQLKIETFELEQKLANKACSLPSYSFEQKNRQLAHLKNKINERQEKVAPKPKFKFSAKWQSTDTPTKQKVSEEATDESKLDLSQFASNEIRIENKKCATICLDNNSVSGNDLILSNLNACTVSICDYIGALRMNNIEHCTIITGPICSSLHVQRMTNSTVCSAMRQCRIHDCDSCQFYLHVNSEPVIEDSNRLQFAPYNVQYLQLETHWKQSGLNRELNLWDRVKDFKWFKKQQSPHWSVIPQKERLDTMSPVRENEDSDDEL